MDCNTSCVPQTHAIAVRSVEVAIPVLSPIFSRTPRTSVGEMDTVFENKLMGVNLHSIAIYFVLFDVSFTFEGVDPW